MIWIVIIAVVIGIVYYKSKNSSQSNSSNTSSSNASAQIQNMWSDLDQTTMRTVNEGWKAYLNRARQEEQSGNVSAGTYSLGTLVHNFLWCVYDLSKFAIDCHGSLSVQTTGSTYNIHATAQLSIDDRKYQVLYKTMIESFFIDTPGIRLEFSDYKRDVDHEESFPWVSRDHTRMIPTTDYYVIGMHFSVSNITSMGEGLLPSFLKTPKDVLDYIAKEHIKYGLTYTVSESNGICTLNYTSHYTEPSVD